MRDDRLQAVREQLGDRLPDGLSELTDDELADFADAVGEAQVEQERALDDAIAHTLRFLPWPLSAIVKKVLVG